MTSGTVLDEFLRYLRYEKRYSNHTVTSYSTDLCQFISFYEANVGEFQPELVSNKQARAWVIYLSKLQLSPRSVNRKLTALRTLFKYLVDKKKCSTNPVQTLHKQKQKKKIPVFAAESVMQDLFDTNSFEDTFEGCRDKLIIELFYATGIRLSELVEIKERDVDLSSHFLTVTGKGNKQRLVPLCMNVEHVYMKYLLKKTEHQFDSDYVFLTSKGLKVYTKLVYRVVRKYLGNVTTMEQRSPHVLRHTFATHVLNNGADLNVIKEILGHSSLAATQVYTHNTFEKLKNSYKQAHPRN